MVVTAYAALKTHYNKVLKTNVTTTGLERIRTTYDRSCLGNINPFGIATTNLSLGTCNPIRKIITLVGPEYKCENIKTGVVISDGELCFIDIITSDFYKDVKANMSAYIKSVYKSMSTVVSFDEFHRSYALAAENPYCSLVRSYAMYFTYHHIKDCYPEYIDENIGVFKDIIETDITAGEDVDLVIHSLTTSRYTEDPEKILGIINAGGKAELFY